MRWGLLAALVSLALAGSAQATTIEGGGTYPFQGWVDEAKVPTPDATIRVIEVRRRGSYAWTDDLGRAIQFDLTDYSPRRTFSTLLGYHFAETDLDDSERAYFAQLVGDAREWSQGPNSVKQMFTAGYSECAIRERPGRPHDWSPPYRRVALRFQAVCAFIRRA